MLQLIYGIPNQEKWISYEVHTMVLVYNAYLLLLNQIPNSLTNPDEYIASSSSLSSYLASLGKNVPASSYEVSRIETGFKLCGDKATLGGKFVAILHATNGIFLRWRGKKGRVDGSGRKENRRIVNYMFTFSMRGHWFSIFCCLFVKFPNFETGFKN